MEPNYAERYRELYTRHWWWRARESYVLRWIHRIAAGRRIRILDVGCGDGLLWPKLADIGDVEGIEPDASLVPPDSAARPKIEIAPFPGRPRESRYDLLLMLDVLEHIDDDRGALDAVAAVLAPGGHALITVPAHMWLWSEFDAINHHKRRYRARDLRVLLARAGLTPVSVRYYYLWPVLPLLLRRAFFRASATPRSSFVAIPPQPINALLEGVSKVDHLLTSVVPFPFGGSIIAVARKD
jgi:SAM-dependent methyltransferase